MLQRSLQASEWNNSTKHWLLTCLPGRSSKITPSKLVNNHRSNPLRKVSLQSEATTKILQRISFATYVLLGSETMTRTLQWLCCPAAEQTCLRKDLAASWTTMSAKVATSATTSSQSGSLKQIWKRTPLSELTTSQKVILGIAAADNVDTTVPRILTC